MYFSKTTPCLFCVGRQSHNFLPNAELYEQLATLNSVNVTCFLHVYSPEYTAHQTELF